MSTGGQRIKWRRNTAENFNCLSKAYKRYREMTDRQAIAYSKREHGFTFLNYSELKSKMTKHVPETLPDADIVYLSLRASRSDSSNVRMSPSRTGPFTLRIIDRLDSSRNSTRTWQQQLATCLCGTPSQV